jgi:hypothetical protein
MGLMDHGDGTRLGIAVVIADLLDGLLAARVFGLGTSDQRKRFDH